MRKIFMLFCVAAVGCWASGANAAPNLTATVAVEQTADTAFAAKSSAMSKARRHIFNEVLSRYAHAHTIEELSSKMTDVEMLNIIGTTSIADEKTSATSYAANITMTLDGAAAQKWLNENNVSNWLETAAESGPRTTVFFEFSGGLRQWIALNKSLREMGFADTDLRLTGMQGKNVTGTIPAGRRGAFAFSLRGLGWTVTDENGIIRAIK